MIETGDWTIPDLVKYLVSVKLQPEEICWLQRTSVFPEEAAAEQNKDGDCTPNKVSDLYEPSDVFRSLGLPIIDWRAKNGKHEWRSDGGEGTPGTVEPPLILMFPLQPSFCSVSV